MGKGKGSFDHWASRIAVSKIIFELKGDLHEKVVRDAFRLAGNKMPGQCCLIILKEPCANYMTMKASMSSLRREIRLLWGLQS